MLIGLNGLKGSGKDTVGSYLVDNYGYERASFAAKLKESAAALFNVNPDIWEDLKNDDKAFVQLGRNVGSFEPTHNISSISIRIFLQRYGTEAHRTVFGSDFWVDHALKGVDRNQNIVFTDARFENELSRIKSLMGVNLQILRPQLTNEDDHISEAPPPIELIDFQIVNDQDLDYLYGRVDDFMSCINTERSILAYDFD